MLIVDFEYEGRVRNTVRAEQYLEQHDDIQVGSPSSNGVLICGRTRKALQRAIAWIDAPYYVQPLSMHVDKKSRRYIFQVCKLGDVDKIETYMHEADAKRNAAENNAYVLRRDMAEYLECQRRYAA